MINSKADLKAYLQRDMKFFYSKSRREQFMCWITKDPICSIAKYIKLLRMEEFYYNTAQNKVGTILYLLYLRRKNRLGNHLGFKIPKNCIGPGLTIYHHGEIIVNESARIGADCVLHGGNCIGNNGKIDTSPVIGDGLDLGIGAKIIGAVQLGNHIRVGANAVVTKSCLADGAVLVGIPANIIKRNDYHEED